MLFSVFYLLVCNSCKPEPDEPVYKNPYSGDIIGKWKLVEVSISKDYENFAIIECLNDNIIYDFQANNTLLVTGLLLDSLHLFDDFKEGEHFYEYYKLDNTSCLPVPNLLIDKLESGTYNGRYFCKVPLDKRTMSISGNKVVNNSITEQLELLNWTKTFIILK